MDPHLPWFILLNPLVAAAVIHLFTAAVARHQCAFLRGLRLLRLARSRWASGSPGMPLGPYRSAVDRFRRGICAFRLA